MPGLSLWKKEKKIGEETINEIKAPGEVRGSDERKAVAAQVRQLRTNPLLKDTDFRKEYLKKRLQQANPKKAETKTAEPKDTATKTLADYEGKGNSLGAMIGRVKAVVANHKPDPVGTKRLKVAKAVGSGLAKGVSGVARELGSIGFSNLE